MAQLAGLYTGVDTITFNTAPLPFNEDTRELFERKNLSTVTEFDFPIGNKVGFVHEDKITNIYNKGDFVTFLSEFFIKSNEVNAGDNAVNILLVPTIKSVLYIDESLGLDFLITGQKIVLPRDTTGALVAALIDHPMNTILEWFNDGPESDSDADFDGLDYAFELSNGLNPNDQDSDGDGLSDSIEIGNDINNPLDTDGDLVIDAIDVANEDPCLPEATSTACLVFGLAQPTGLQVVDSSAIISLQWDQVDGATGYEVYIGISPRNSIEPTVYQTTDTSLSTADVNVGVSYYVSVRAIGQAQDSEESEVVQVNVVEKPEPEEDLAVVYDVRPRDVVVGESIEFRITGNFSQRINVSLDGRICDSQNIPGGSSSTQTETISTTILNCEGQEAGQKELLVIDEASGQVLDGGVWSINVRQQDQDETGLVRLGVPMEATSSTPSFIDQSYDGEFILLTARVDGATADVVLNSQGQSVVSESEQSKYDERTLYLYERSTGRASIVVPAGKPFYGNSARISGDGNVVVFESFSDSLQDQVIDTNGLWDVFKWDRRTGETTLLSTAGSDTNNTSDNDSSFRPLIDYDGSRIVFSMSDEIRESLALSQDGRYLISGLSCDRNLFRACTGYSSIRVEGPQGESYLSNSGRDYWILGQDSNKVLEFRLDGPTSEYPSVARLYDRDLGTFTDLGRFAISASDNGRFIIIQGLKNNTASGNYTTSGFFIDDENRSYLYDVDSSVFLELIGGLSFDEHSISGDGLRVVVRESGEMFSSPLSSILVGD